MPSNNTASTNRQAYHATVELAFDQNGNRTYVNPENIVYIMIEHDYDNQVLPIIYVCVSVGNDLYNKIVRYKDTAKFYLNIKKTNQNSTAAVSRSTINGTFNYIPSTTNPNFQQDLVTGDDFLDNSYKRIMIGLVSIELTNKLRKSFNQIYNNIDQKTLVALALEGTNCVIENLTYNKRYTSLMVPPLSSRYKMLEFIFDEDNFYDTSFRYFMDFERSYLVSKKGNAINANDGDLSSVIVNIRAVTDNEAYYDGIEVRNGSYYVYINPSNSNVILNEGIEKVANQIVALDDDYTVQTLDLNINNTEGSETKQTFIRASNAAIYKNELETNTITIEILKQHIDGTYFTPNKCITVNNYGEYKKYNGRYIMSYKREFYKCIAGEFVMSCNVGLKKIGNVQSLQNYTTNSSNGYSKGSATRTTTKTYKTSTSSVSAAGSARSLTT